MTQHLIQLLLPLHNNEQQEFPKAYFVDVRAILTDRFGGVTAFVRSPAIGLWKETKDEVSRDEVVMFEVITDQLDTKWWADYRLQLQDKFLQDEILIWATSIMKL
ncbi:MAG TPA: hypothetical protein VGN86_16820 [Pyrinomonadaceae bacterium]|nr:hypothetical protein [Pyrinomonadaceae bacterium]